MKKIYIFTFTTVLVVSAMILAFGSLGAFNNIIKPKSIMQVFETTDVEVLKTSVYGKGIIREANRTNKELEGPDAGAQADAGADAKGRDKLNVDSFAQIAEKVISNFKILPGTIEKDKNESDSYIQYRIYGQTVEKELVAATIWSEKKHFPKESDIYISLELLNDDIYSDLESKRRQINAVLIPFAIDVKTSLSITGTYSGRIDERKLEQMAKKNALNSSIRYSRYEDKTYITLTSVFN